jgi:hypothetical protein
MLRLNSVANLCMYWIKAIPGGPKRQPRRQLGLRQAFISKSESDERPLDPVELARFANVYGKPLTSFLR